MSGFFQDQLLNAAGAFFGSDFLRDYTHASKTFRPNAYQNAPKFKYLFHVYFQINLGTGAPVSNYGLLVKSVKLPSFSFDTTTLNQYNRKRLIQTKIKYDPIDITFHDDNGTATGTPTAGGSARALWKAYYNYYYSDGRNPSGILAGAPGATPISRYNPSSGTISSADYNVRTQYTPSITGNANWGYNGDTQDPSGQKIPFFKNITIFGFNQHNFTAYTLINPIITRFTHDTYDYAQSTGIMQNQMTLDYETVVYNEGAISGKAPGDIVTGFGSETNYDRTLSPIARPGSQQNILGQGGLMSGIGGAVNSLRDGNILGAIQAAGTSYNTFKNTNPLNIAKSEVLSGITNAVQGTPNRNLNVSTPIFGATPSTTGTASSPPIAQASPTVPNSRNAGLQI
jgi:hypothetical protein